MNNKNCVYILESAKDKKFYIGQTDDLAQRMYSHNRGSVCSTKNRRPLELIYFETFNSRNEAVKQESYIKSLKNTKNYLLSMAPSSNG